jgi:hypothetical protein
MELTGLVRRGGPAPAVFVTPGADGARSGVNGRLGFDDAALRFTGSGADLLLDVDSMLGMSISGRAVSSGGHGPRGTMRVAAVAGQSPAEWVFGIDRTAAVRLRTEALPWVLLGAVLLVAEVVVPLLLVKGG